MLIRVNPPLVKRILNYSGITSTKRVLRLNYTMITVPAAGEKNIGLEAFIRGIYLRNIQFSAPAARYF